MQILKHIFMAFIWKSNDWLVETLQGNIVSTLGSLHTWKEFYVLVIAALCFNFVVLLFFFLPNFLSTSHIHIYALICLGRYFLSALPWWIYHPGNRRLGGWRGGGVRLESKCWRLLHLLGGSSWHQAHIRH